MIPTRRKSIKSDPGPCFCVSDRRRQARQYTYTLTQSTTGTDEKTSTNRTANGNHVEMARAHGAVELDNAATVFLLREGLHVQAIACCPAVLADVASDLLSTAGVVARKATGGLLIGLDLGRHDPFWCSHGDEFRGFVGYTDKQCLLQMNAAGGGPEKNRNDGEEWLSSTQHTRSDGGRGRFIKEMPIERTGTGAQGLRVLVKGGKRIQSCMESR